MNKSLDVGVSLKILEIRALAGNPGDVCPTCGKVQGAPYRFHLSGKIEAGCVDAFHTGYLVGASLVWHDRPVAHQIRRDQLKHLRKVLSGRTGR